MSRFCWECSRPIAKGHRAAVREIATGQNVTMHFKCAKSFDARTEHVNVYALIHDDVGKGMAPSDSKGPKT